MTTARRGSADERRATSSTSLRTLMNRLLPLEHPLLALEADLDPDLRGA
jgi:hypothetical protein